MFFFKRSSVNPIRILYCSDLHAAEGVYRKLLNAVKLNVYKAHAVVIGGDLTGKAIVPVVRAGGRYTARVRGEDYTAETRADLEKVIRAIQDHGYYPHVAEPDEVAALEQDPQRREALFDLKMQEQVAAWVALAEERIGDSGVQFWMMPGNDDHFSVDPIIAASRYVQDPARRVVELPGGLVMVSTDYANPTPWNTPREWSEDEYYEQLRQISSAVGDLSRCVFNIHVPPYNTGLDTAPILDADLRPTVSAGDVLKGPVGSKGVRRAIEELQPLVGVHGHIHESAGESRIGRTVVLNPGSETESMRFKGHVVDLLPGKVERYFRVEG